MHAINTNAVRGRYYEIFYMKIYHTKVSLHKNFQIYSIHCIYCTSACNSTAEPEIFTRRIFFCPVFMISQKIWLTYDIGEKVFHWIFSNARLGKMFVQQNILACIVWYKALGIKITKSILLIHSLRHQ